MAQATKPLFDFTTEQGRQGWVAAHDIAKLSASPEGLVIAASGDDPYVHSPLATVPASKTLWLVMRLKSSQNGMAQVFFFAPPAYASEEKSVRFPVRAGRWEEVRVALPPLPAEKCHFRIDPPGTKGGVTTLAALTLEPRVELVEPTWPDLVALPAATYFELKSGELSLRHTIGMGAFALSVAGVQVALGHNRPLLGYQAAPASPLRWINVAERATVTGVPGGYDLRAAFRDDDGGVWAWRQSFTPRASGQIEVTTTLTCDKDRLLVHFPSLAVVAADRTQALLCGIEYLDAPDKSSSEDDLTGPQAKRHVPDAHQHTIPLMALAHAGHWLGLSWERSSTTSACFDSPNRRMGSTGHLLGTLFPGSQRQPGSILPDGATLAKADEPLTSVATLSGGLGPSVLPALEAWVREHPLPSAPKLPVNPEKLALTGLLESGGGEKGLFRHALPGDFKPQPAPDAALLLEVLGQRGPAAQAKSKLASPLERGIGHIQTLAPALAFGAGVALQAGAKTRAEQLLTRFSPDGTVPYQAGKVDYGKTHYEKTANGLIAPHLLEALESAQLSGEKPLLEHALRIARQVQARWKNTVPRGAQTWEVPLHTPDILASAYLVKVFVLAFELTGDQAFLETARYWAWTGVPFVYLVPPGAREEIGVYATIAVLGATGWIAPNWIGLPVQWCGLVYADALLDLSAHDRAPLWKQLAEGICASGVQQSFPTGSDPLRQGLLPDSFNLVAQLRNDPVINPLTLLVPWLRSQGKPLYTRAMLAPGVLVHAPGRVTLKPPKQVSITGCIKGSYSVLVTGLSQEPRQFRGNVKKVGYNSGVLILEATGSVAFEL